MCAFFIFLTSASVSLSFATLLDDSIAESYSYIAVEINSNYARVQKTNVVSASSANNLYVVCIVVVGESTSAACSCVLVECDILHI